MPTITRIYIKTSLIYLFVTFVLGMLMAMHGMSRKLVFVSYLTPVYYHLLMVGWITQLIFGIVYWMFPKYSKELPRGRDSVAWATYISLNLGLIVRVMAEPMNSLSANVWWGILLLLSALALWLAGILFVANTWPRLKER